MFVRFSVSGMKSIVNALVDFSTIVKHIPLTAILSPIDSKSTKPASAEIVNLSLVLFSILPIIFIIPVNIAQKNPDYRGYFATNVALFFLSPSYAEASDG